MDIGSGPAAVILIHHLVILSCPRNPIYLFPHAFDAVREVMVGLGEKALLYVDDELSDQPRLIQLGFH